MEMTYERAAEILDPEHLENYSIETVKEACRDRHGCVQEADPGKGEFVGKLTIRKLPALPRSRL